MRARALLRIVADADGTLFRFVYFRTRNPVFDALMPTLSLAGNRGALWIAAAVLAFVFGGRDEKTAAAAALAAVALSGAIAEFTIKMVYRRERPFRRYEDVVPRVRGRRFRRRPSFPSGHSAGYFGAAWAYSCFFPQYAFWFYLVAALGAYSRVYNGVHFPLDAAAGALIGLAVGWVVCGS